MAEYGHQWKKATSLGLACFLATLIGGCPFNPERTLVFHEDDSGSDVTVDDGTRLTAVLSGNASTGYEWEVTELDTAVLEHTGTTYGPDCGMTGCGGTEYWTFTALSPGRATVRMVYHRPWEEEEPTRTFELTVAVTD
jgi:inhibitor of cysteine peptidase